MYDEDSIILAFSIMCNRTEGKTGRDYCILKEKLAGVISRMNKDSWTEERKESQRQMMFERNKDPEYQQKIRDGVAYAMEHYNLGERKSKNGKEVWEREGYQDKMKESMKDRIKFQRSKEGRKEVSDRNKRQNKENPGLMKKRLDALTDHMYNKSEEWKEKIGVITKEWMNKPEYKEKYSNLLLDKNHPMNKSREVYNKETGEVYRSLKYASEELGMNYSTIKKYFYAGNEKCPVKEIK